MDEKVTKLLEEHWLFRSLTANETEVTASKLRRAAYNSGEYVFHQSDVSDKLFIITSGEVSIEVVSLNGQITVLATLSEDEIFGEFALIDGQPRSASARAQIDTEILYLEKTDFLELLTSNPQFSLALMRGLVARLRRSNLQIESLSTLSLRKRLLETLIELSGVKGSLSVTITQAQLAERVSASREKVNVNLKHLAQQGLITIKRGKIDINDMSRAKTKLLTE